MRIKQGAALAATAFATAAVGCGSEEPTAETVTEERTVVEQAPPPQTKTVTVPARKPQRRPKPKPAAANLVTVPDVVGENHQYAQDDMQAAGLYSLDERDASGEGRMLLWDRNWIVVEQDPPAGSRVSEDTTVTLTSRHEDD